MEHICSTDIQEHILSEEINQLQLIDLLHCHCVANAILH